MASLTSLVAVDFEVVGRVQGVFFRKYTVNKGRELQLRGWVRNTDCGKVVGHMEGKEKAVREMKYWLQNVGSPHSRIDRCTFQNESSITDYTLPEFKVRY